VATRPGLLRSLRLLGWAALVGGVYLLNLRTPGELRLDILFVIPVLLAAWHDGMHWGIAFALATSLLRFRIGIDQLPPTTLVDYRVLNELAYLAVVGVAITGLSQLRHTHSQLEQLAIQDPLTNVLNARAFSHELAQELSRNRRYGRPLALIYLDLDDFKSINDAHGHATGDAVLRLGHRRPVGGRRVRGPDAGDRRRCGARRGHPARHRHPHGVSGHSLGHRQHRRAGGLRHRGRDRRAAPQGRSGHVRGEACRQGPCGAGRDVSDTLRTLQDLFLIFTSVLFIVDPLTAVPTFLAMTARDPPQVRRLMARRGAWTCAITLTAFALGGSLIFRLFGITIGAFKIAGGVLIGLNALDMVQARRSQQRETAVEKAEGIEKEDVGIMPLGVPMLAGPGAISTVMVLAGASKSVVTTAGVYVAIALTAFLTYITLAAAPRVEAQLGQTGMRILTRLMGLVLCAIAVQFIIDGIKMAGL